MTESVTVRPSEVALAARRAITLLDARGWTQGHMIDNDDRLCLLGAIALADSRVCVELAAAVRGVLGGQHLARWNDEPGRTVDEVRAVLEKAAARLAEVGQ